MVKRMCSALVAFVVLLAGAGLAAAQPAAKPPNILTR